MDAPEETGQQPFEQSDYFNDGLCNWTAGAAPTVDDDAADGYQPGSVWYKATVPYGLWKCVDATAGAAVWKEEFLTGSGFGALSPLTTKGDVLGFSTINARVPVGANNTVLTADSAQTLGLKWDNPLTIGRAITGGGANRILHQDGSGNLAASSGLTYDGAKLGIGSSQISSPTGTAFFAGNFAGSNRVSGSNQVGIGQFALGGALTGNNNVAIGTDAGSALTSGSANLFIGTGAGASMVSGQDNMFLGSSAGYFQTGSANVFIGSNAGQGTTGSSGARNIGIGQASLTNLTSGIENSALGSSSLLSLTTGYSNTVSGFEAGRSITTAWENTFLGYKAGYSCVTGLSNVFIGHQAGYNETGSNKLYISNSNTATPLIYGEFDNELVRVNGYIRSSKFKDYMGLMSQVGTSAPTVDIVDNSLGTVVWTRNSAGNYTGTLTGAFGTQAKCWFTPKWAHYPEDDYLIKMTYGSADYITLESEEALSGTDGLLVSFPIHIRVLQ